VFNEYFKLVNCIYEGTCKNANTYECNNCTRNSRYLVDNYKVKIFTNSSPCDNCSCNPKNGGSGICNCTLNLPEIR